MNIGRRASSLSWFQLPCTLTSGVEGVHFKFLRKSGIVPHGFYILSGLCRQTTCVINSCGVAGCVRFIWKALRGMNGIHTSYWGLWMVTWGRVSLEGKMASKWKSVCSRSPGKVQLTGPVCGRSLLYKQKPFLLKTLPLLGLPGLRLPDTCHMATEVILICSRQVTMSISVEQGWHEARGLFAEQDLKMESVPLWFA